MSLAHGGTGFHDRVVAATQAADAVGSVDVATARMKLAGSTGMDVLLPMAGLQLLLDLDIHETKEAAEDLNAGGLPDGDAFA